MIYGKTHKLTPAEREIYKAGHNDGEWFQAKTGLMSALAAFGVSYLYYRWRQGDVNYHIDYSEDE